MIGRNDPCPCGSGKKYKKCCFNKELKTVDEVLEEELERALQIFYDVYPQKKDYKNYSEIVNSWHKQLGEKMETELIEAIALDYFFFHERLDIWQDYLEKTIKETIRPATKAILETWMEPKMVFGKVTAVDAQYMTVENIYSKETFKLKRLGDRAIPENVHVFGFILRENMQDATQFIAISTMIFFPTDHSAVFENFQIDRERAETAFWKEHAIDLWKALSENGFDGSEFTNFEEEVLQKMTDYLLAHNRNADKLLPLVEDYIVDQQPKARKPMAIAAGAIRFGNDNHYFDKIDTTVKAIAEAFDVSASSLNKYDKEIAEYAKMKL